MKVVVVLQKGFENRYKKERNIKDSSPVNGPGKDRTGDEEEQTEMVWTCG